MIEYPPFKAAVVQAAPIYMDLEGGLDKACALIAKAAAAGARLIAFPETWIPGAPWWVALGAPSWGVQFVRRYYANSLVFDSPAAKRLNEAARANDIYVVMGCSERDGGSLYMSQLLIDGRGETIAGRRKLKPTLGERTVFGEGDGSDLAVHDTALGRLGALCCWEHLQPLTKYAMYSMGEQIHVAAWPSFSLCRGLAYAFGPELNNAASQIYAAEGQCFVLAPSATVSEEMVELLCDTEDKRAMLRTGGGYARAYGPDGSPLGTPLAENEEGLLLIDVDLDLILLAKSATDPVGHYSRPDVTRLLLNRTPARRVETFRPVFETLSLPERKEQTEQHAAQAIPSEA